MNMKTTRNVLLASLLGLSAYGCENDDSAIENVGESIEEGAEEVADEIADAT